MHGVHVSESLRGVQVRNVRHAQRDVDAEAASQSERGGAAANSAELCGAAESGGSEVGGGEVESTKATGRERRRDVADAEYFSTDDDVARRQSSLQWCRIAVPVEDDDAQVDSAAVGHPWLLLRLHYPRRFSLSLPTSPRAATTAAQMRRP